ncbi:MAG: hypothetical protein AB7C98_09740 [Acidithiobacillus sp.]
MAAVFNSPEISFQLNLDGAAVLAPAPVESPIDIFYEQRLLALNLAGSPPLSSDYSRPLGLVPLFAGAEMYFRRFIARSVSICPFVAEHASTQQVALGSFLSLDKSERAFAISEHQGFTSEGEISRRTQKITGIDINRYASLKAAIQDFETVCHVRHSIVHCNGELMFIGRRTIGVSKVGRLILSMSVADYQNVVVKVSNVVRAYNGIMGNELSKRWFREGYLSGKWGDDRRKFLKLISLVWSVTDMGPQPTCRALYDQIRTSV